MEKIKEILKEFIEWAEHCGEDAWYIFEHTEEAIEKFLGERDDSCEPIYDSNVTCGCKNNIACTKEQDGNGEWKDYCWKCKCFRN